MILEREFFLLMMKMNKKYVISIILGVLFIGLVYLIKSNNIVNFDNYVYNLVPSNMNDGLTLFYKVYTVLGSTIFIVLLCKYYL